MARRVSEDGDGDDMFLRNVGWFSTGYTELVLFELSACSLSVAYLTDTSTLKREAKCSFETLVTLRDYVVSHIPEESTLDSNHRENLKSNLGYLRFETVKAVNMTWRCVVWYVVTNVSEDNVASLFRVEA
jgi:hypothetical protein